MYGGREESEREGDESTTSACMTLCVCGRGGELASLVA